MSQYEININNKYTRTYKTKEGLIKGLKKYGFYEDRFVIVRNDEGRWTAIFPLSNFVDGGYVGLYSSKGFLTMG